MLSARPVRQHRGDDNIGAPFGQALRQRRRDQRIDAERQMRPMLFSRAQRQREQTLRHARKFGGPEFVEERNHPGASR